MTARVETGRVRELDVRLAAAEREIERLRVEAARPRPRVQWTAPVGGWTEAHLAGFGVLGSPMSLAVATMLAERLTAAGFDVDEVPRA